MQEKEADWKHRASQGRAREGWLAQRQRGVWAGGKGHGGGYLDVGQPSTVCLALANETSCFREQNNIMTEVPGQGSHACMRTESVCEEVIQKKQQVTCATRRNVFER